MSREPAAVRVYTTLLRLYPRSFRDRFGADMVQLLRDQCGDEPAWRVGARAAADLAITIPTQHLEIHMNRRPTHLVPLSYTALALSGLLLAVVGGSNLALVAIGLGVAFVAGATAVVSWRRHGPVTDGSLAANWWKLVLAGPCLVVAVVVAAALGVNAWYLGMFAVALGLVVTAAGSVLGLARLLHQHRAAHP